MNAQHNERRAKMLEKVRKLLSMARDGRGNQHEEETAMRQASKLMAEFGIAEAECDMAAINAGEMVFGEATVNPDGKATKEGKVYRSVPSWAGILAVGVAKFTDTICAQTTTVNGRVFVFRGEREDTLLARWLFGVLVDSIQQEQKRSGWTGRGDASSFRTGAAGALQRRLRDLAIERRRIYEEAKVASGSRALVVVDTKAAVIAERFGAQKTRATRHRESGAVIAGRQAGQRINIPAGRPLGGGNQGLLR